MSARQKYAAQRHSARKRGIAFLLTFDEWLDLWIKSGKWSNRGRYRGNYCMARFGDKGPYAIGNVEIITFEQNCMNRRASAETRAKLKKARIGKTPCLGKRFSAQERAAISAALIGRTFSVEHRKKIAAANRGKRHSPQAKLKMSLAKIGNQYARKHPILGA